MENMMVVFVNALVDQIVKDGIDRDCITVQEVRKNNNTVLTGITIRKTADTMIFPIVYVNQYKGAFDSHTKTLDQIAKEIIKESVDAMGPDPNLQINRESILKRAFLQAVCAHTNTENLKEVPYETMLDIAFIVRSRVEIGGADGSILVTNNVMKEFGITHDELFKAAKENVSNSFLCIPMSKMLDMLMHTPDLDEEDDSFDQEDDMGMYVATNKDKVYGASILAFPEVIAKYAEKIGGDLYILPSSVHEVLLLKKNGGMDPDDLRSMVTEINATQVKDEEVLTDNVYEFDIKTKELRVA